jgi:hypothetical protein
MDFKKKVGVIYLFFNLKNESAPSETIPLNEVKSDEPSKPPKEIESHENEEPMAARKTSKKSVVPSNDL